MHTLFTPHRLLINMEQYLLYLLIVTLTVASPGPGVVLTLSNAIKYGMKPTLSGILGIALGIFIIAVISASSLGILLATSALAFSILKFLGAAYLIYLGLKLWKAPPMNLGNFEENSGAKKLSYSPRFKEGFLVSLLNPKPIFFFMSLFPQFINHQQSYLLQFSYLTLTFCTVIILVHSLYALGANAIKFWLSSPKGSTIVNRTSGSVFIFFGLGLAATSQK